MSSIRRHHRLETDVPPSVTASSAVVVRAARRLPNELLLHIAGFTDRATSIRLRQVSKGFNAMIDSIRWTWLSFRKEGDYATLFVNDGPKIRAQTREIHAYAFPPQDLYDTHLLAALAHNNLVLDKVVYRTRAPIPSSFSTLFSPQSIEFDFRIGTSTSFDSIHQGWDADAYDPLWWTGSRPWIAEAQRHLVSSVSFHHVTRPWVEDRPIWGMFNSPHRASYPALDEVVLHLLPGVSAAAFEEALRRWFAALRACPAAQWTNQKEADWRRVLRIKGHVDDDI